MTTIALITGATGFVGSQLVQRLVCDGWQVHVIGRPTSKFDRLVGVQDKVVVHRHDGTTEGLTAIVQQAQPEVVFHLASLFIAEHQSKDVVPLIQNNVMFGAQLLEAMKQCGVARLVNTGTFWQHYENRDYSPVCLYAATKQAFESLLQYYCETACVRAITLKLFDTYGPNDPRPKLFDLLSKIPTQQEPLLMSPGEQFLDLVYIDDVVDAFVVAANRLRTAQDTGHEAYAVTSRAPIKLKELVALYGKARGITLPIQWGGRPYRFREVMMPWSKGDLLPGWRQRIGLQEGILRTLACQVQKKPDANG